MGVHVGRVTPRDRRVRPPGTVVVTRIGTIGSMRIFLLGRVF